MPIILPDNFLHIGSKIPGRIDRVSPIQPNIRIVTYQRMILLQYLLSHHHMLQFFVDQYIELVII